MHKQEDKKRISMTAGRIINHSSALPHAALKWAFLQPPPKQKLKTWTTETPLSISRFHESRKSFRNKLNRVNAHYLKRPLWLEVINLLWCLCQSWQAKKLIYRGCWRKTRRHCHMRRWPPAPPRHDTSTKCCPKASDSLRQGDNSHCTTSRIPNISSSEDFTGHLSTQSIYACENVSFLLLHELWSCRISMLMITCKQESRWPLNGRFYYCSICWFHVLHSSSESGGGGLEPIPAVSGRERSRIKDSTQEC